MRTIHGYLDLYERLKGPGLESILSKEVLDHHDRQALRIISRLPDPWSASPAEIAEVCRMCSMGELELLFKVASIGETARTIAHEIEEAGGPTALSPTAEDLSTAMSLQSAAIDRLAFAVTDLTRKCDLNLKGRCIYCHGDLVEVVVDPGAGRPKELRLQCRRQAHAKCKTLDWYLQDVDERTRA